MANNQLRKKVQGRVKRAHRVRNAIRRFANRTRLTVTKSNKHIQVQIIDQNGNTLAGTATFAKEFRNTEFNKKGKPAAKKLGERIAQLASEKGIEEVVLDRGSHNYNGIIAEFANAARAGGLKF